MIEAILFGYWFGGILWILVWGYRAYDAWRIDRKQALQFAWLSPVWPFVVIFVGGKRFFVWLYGVWNEARH